MKESDILLRVGRRIRQFRKMYQMSQEQLAEKADLHPTFIGKIERAEINPSIVSLKKIADAFKVPVSELLSFEEDRERYDENVKTIVDSLEKATKELKVARDLVYTYKSSKKKTKK